MTRGSEQERDFEVPKVLYLREKFQIYRVCEECIMEQVVGVMAPREHVDVG